MAFSKGLYTGLDMVLCNGHCVVWRGGLEGCRTMEGHALKNCKCIADFVRGKIVGFLAAGIIFACIAGIVYAKQKNKELLEYAERKQVIEELRESYINLDPDDFIEAVPDVRRAVDGAGSEFERKRDEILQRFRNRIAD